MRTVVVVEGPQGVGKTTVLRELRERHGAALLEEGVLDLASPFPAQSLPFEAQWLVQWADRVARLPEGAVVLADRGPASAVHYTRSGGGVHLQALAGALLDQLRREHGVRFRFVRLDCGLEAAQGRVRERADADRAGRFRELEEGWLEACFAFYESADPEAVHGQPWALVVRNEGCSAAESADRLAPLLSGGA